MWHPCPHGVYLLAEETLNTQTKRWAFMQHISMLSTSPVPLCEPGKAISLCLTFACLLSAKPNHHAEGILSQLQDKRNFDVHIVLLIPPTVFIQNSFQIFWSAKVTWGYSKKSPKFSFLAIASLEISHKGTVCSYEYNCTMGKMQENAWQNLLNSHNLLTLGSYLRREMCSG